MPTRMNNFFLSVFTSSPLPRPQSLPLGKAEWDAVVEGGVLLLPLSTALFFILFFYLLYLHNPRCGLHFWSLSSSFRRMSCACTHRKILPATTPRNAGGISPRAHEAGGRMCEGRFSVPFP